MPAFTSIALGLGLALGGAGLATSMSAASSMRDAQQQEIAAQQKIEAEKKKQMDLQYQRSQMEMLRNFQRARAMSLATSVSQGAQFGSVLPGAYGGESGQYNTMQEGLNQNLQIGNAIFGYNQQISGARSAYADAQANYGMGSGLSSLGGQLVTNAGSIGAVGQSSWAALQRGMSFGTGPGSFGMGNSWR